jgi:predicted RNA-binding protein (virulence factor B family)
VGQFHDLPVENFSDYGVYLSFGRDRVLLPNKYVPEEIDVGETIRVFVYTDSEDRPVATTLAPAGVVGDIVALKVRDTSAFGVFMDWGLEKDLLVPRSEQQGRMAPGEIHLVKIFLDRSTHRVYGSARLEKLCPGDAQNLTVGEAVDLIIHSISPIGYTAIINQTCLGMLYENDTFEPLAIGDRCRGYVLKIREDGKVDLSLKQPGYASVKDSALKILQVLEDNGGFSPCHDKSSPEQIQAAFSMSKKEFKRALGNLYKQGRISLHKTEGIRLKYTDGEYHG